MNRFEKIAWYNLAVFAVSLIAYPCFFLFLRSTHSVGVSLEIAVYLTGAVWGLLWGIRTALFRKDRPASAPELDERDRMIERRAKLHGFGVFWILLGLCGMGAGLYGKGSLPPLQTNLLCLVVLLGYGIVMVVSSVSTIIQYRSDFICGDVGETGDGSEKRRVRNAFLFSAFFLIVVLAAVVTAHPGWAFAAAFMMTVFAALQMGVHVLRKGLSTNVSGGSVRALKIAEWTMGVLFAGCFAASSVAVFIAHRTESAIFTILLYLLGFGLLIFLLAIRDYFPRVFPKRRCEAGHEHR